MRRLVRLGLASVETRDTWLFDMGIFPPSYLVRTPLPPPDGGRRRRDDPRGARIKCRMGCEVLDKIPGYILHAGGFVAIFGKIATCVKSYAMME